MWRAVVLIIKPNIVFFLSRRRGYLSCLIARYLLQSSSENKVSVTSLVQDTMNKPRCP